MSIRCFGPGERSKNHPREECRGHSALVTEYGKYGVAYLSLHDNDELMTPFVRVVQSHRSEFDQWYTPDPKTPPKRLAEVLHQHARRLGATSDALDVLRQFVPINDQEYKAMVAKAEAVTPKATFGAAPAKTTKTAPVKAEGAEPAAKPVKATKAAPAAKAEAKPAPKAAAPKAPKADETIKFVKLPKDIKLPPQARRIVEVLKDAGKAVTSTELYKLLDGELPTKQPVERVFTFYKKKLVEDGLISVK